MTGGDMDIMNEIIVPGLPIWFIGGILGWHAGSSMARKEWILTAITTIALVTNIVLGAR